MHAAEQKHPEVAQARAAWAAQQPALASGRLIFLDEAAATTHMIATRGRSIKGERCRGDAPAGHWRTTTLVCALSTHELLAPLVLDGPINGAAFLAWVEQFLAPELAPDYNPIEQVFTKLKTLLRKAQARTLGSLWSTIGSLLEQFSSSECERHIRHSGYCQSG